MNPLHLKRTTNADPDFRALVHQLDAFLRDEYGDTMDTYDQHNVIEQNNTVVVAYLNNEAVGCGCFKLFDEEAVEVKRMFVHPGSRGKGISKLVLTELETWAKELNYTHTVLETGEKLENAMALYHNSGYYPIPRYEPYVDLPESRCFKKRLV